MANDERYTFKPLKTLAGWARGLMIVQLMSVALLVVVLVAGLAMGTPVDMNSEVPDGIDMVGALAVLLDVAVEIVSGIVALFWIYGAARNTRALRPQLDLKPAWAVIWFFIPFAFLFKPYQYMARIWETAVGPRDGIYPKNTGPLGAWWGLFIISVISSNIASRITDPTAYAYLAIISGVSGFIATLYFMKIVAEVTRMQGQGGIQAADHF